MRSLACGVVEDTRAERVTGAFAGKRKRSHMVRAPAALATIEKPGPPCGAVSELVTRRRSPDAVPLASNGQRRNRCPDRGSGDRGVVTANAATQGAAKFALRQRKGGAMPRQRTTPGRRRPCGDPAQPSPSKTDLPLLRIHLDAVLGSEMPFDDLLCQRVLDALPDRALQRPGAEHRPLCQTSCRLDRS